MDPILTTLLKSCLDVLIEPITTIVNVSLKSGSFPSNWKTSIVKPLLKKPNLEHELKNYCPVRNLTFMSKIIEKSALHSLVPYLESTNLFSIKNSAYKSKHSTETLITKINSEIMTSMGNQKVTILVLLDLSATFDTVNQSKLINIFNTRFGNKIKALKWLKSYLTERKLQVNDINSTSETLELQHGVPQGSCL